MFGHKETQKKETIKSTWRKRTWTETKTETVVENVTKKKKKKDDRPADRIILDIFFWKILLIVRSATSMKHPTMSPT